MIPARGLSANAKLAKKAASCRQVRAAEKVV
jgi:hypothetical protein